MPPKKDWKQSGGKASGRPDSGSGSGGSGGGRPERADWRRAGGRSPAGSGSSPGEREWTQHQGYEGEKLLWVFRAKVAAGALLAVGLFGVLIWYLVPPTRTPFVSTTLVQYQYPIPPNAWAGEDDAAIRELLAKEGVGSTGDEPLSVNDRPPVNYLSLPRKDWLPEIYKQLEVATDDSWGARLRRLDRGPGDGAVILYVSGHGVVDSKGRACLLLPRRSRDDDLLSDDHWLPISDFFDALFYDHEKKTQRLPSAVLKLVVFDANRIDTAWHLGMIHNDFAGKLRNIVEQLPVDNLFVLNSADRGQIGYATPELGGSVFSFFFRRAMQGLADQGPFGNDNDRVSVKELAVYLQAKVPQWVDNYRSDRQRPILIRSRNTQASDAETDLAYYGPRMSELDDPASKKKATAARTARVKTMRTRWEKLRRRFWDSYDDLSAGAIRFHPLRWQEFQSKLLRLERLIAAGPLAMDDKAFTQRLLELDGLKDLLQQRPAQGETPNSVALIQATHPGRRLEETIQGLAGKLAAGEALETTADYATRARAAWRWLEKNPTPANIDAAVGKAIPLQEVARRPNKELVEIHFLRLLRRGLDEHLWQSDSKIIRRIVSLRGQAELAASPPDERLHYWLRSGVDEGDRIRRNAQDNLIVGRDAELTLAATDAEGAARQYRSAQDLTDILVAAYRLQDRGWAEIPQMIAYHARRLPTGLSPAESDGKISTLLTLRSEIEVQLSDFEKLAQANGSFPAKEIVNLRDRVKRLAAGLQSERQTLKRQMTQFIAGASDDDRRTIEGALAVPILTGGDRGRLMNTYLDLLSNYRFVDAPTSPTKTSDEAATPGRFRRIAAWKVHPALALLGLSSAGLPAEAGARAGKASQLIKERLGELTETLKAISGDSRRLVDLELYTTSGAPAKRAKLKADARRLRKASGLFRPDPLPGITPSEGLARYDRQRMLLWHCQRTIDDWLGPAQVGDEKYRPFFLTAANHYLAMARSAAGGKNAAQLEAKIKQRAQASQTKGSDRSIIARFAEKDRELLVRTGDITKPHQVSITLTRNSGGHLPSGKAAYYLAGPRGEPIDIRESDTDPPADLGRLDYRIDPRPDQLGQPRVRKYTILDIQQQMRSQTLQGFLAYRGHQFTGPAMVLRLTPYGCTRDMRYVFPQYAPPVVQIKGPRKRLAVMIVLDCSSSMEQTMNEKGTRLKLAIDVIRNILDDIQDVRNVEVGLRLYGHRARYYPNKAGQQAVEYSDYARHFKGDHLTVRPPADVEKVTSGFTTPAKVLKKFPVELQIIKPHGRTPLYLAMYRAITEDFKQVDAAEVRRQVIVITDGVNVQYTQDSDSSARVRVADATAEKPAVLVTHTDVRDAIRRDRRKNGDPIQISVIGIGVEAEPKLDNWIIGSESELRTLLGKNNGNEFIEINSNNVKQLESELRHSMGLYQYDIVNTASGQPVPLRVEGHETDGKAELGQAVSILGGAKNVSIRFSKSLMEPYPIRVSGGERLTLRINDLQLQETSRKVLEHYGDTISEEPFRLGERKTPEISGPRGLLRFRPHKPVWQGNGVRFFVAMQYKNPDEPISKIFTPRPREVFAVVRPFTDGRRSRFESQYAMFDVKFEPNRSIPLMSFLAPDWPQDAKEAEIFVWIKFDKPTPPDEIIQVGQPDPLKRMEVGGSSIRFEVKAIQQSDDTYVIKVTEKHTDDTSYDTVRVQMEPDRQPDRIGRCYFTEAKTVEHSFIYEKKSSLTLSNLDRYRVQLTKVEKIKKKEKDEVLVRFPDKKPILVRVGPKP